ncbi:MAG: M1 family metallopeptidase [Asgard group archaeon]|nr:M1 family metallopeptidase [Asgard group archaeon]
MIVNIGEYLNESFKKEFQYEILHYDISYKIDASNYLFTSNQKITFENKKNVNIIEGVLEERLIVDFIKIRDKKTHKKILFQWEIRKFEEPYVRDDGLVGIYGKVIVIELEKPLKAGQEIVVEINFHMNKEEIMKSKPKYMWTLCIHKDISYSIEPYSGHYFMLIPARLAAPFDITIEYPEDQIACIPGNQVSKKKQGNYNVEHYKSKTKNIPVFAISNYKKIAREKDGLGVLFYLYNHQTLNEELVDKTFEILQLYISSFGDNGTRFYKCATVGENPSKYLGGENKGNTIYYSEQFFSEDLSDKSKLLFFISGNAHEIYHNWNLFYSGVRGILSQWFGEGGANFVAAWAIEKIIGAEEGASIRGSYLSDYIKKEGYKATEPLASASKLSGIKSRVLMYSFGALVWEQLKQKVGENAIINGLKKFYQRYPFQKRSYVDFFSCIQEETDVNVGKYMEQWMNYKTKIEMQIKEVTFQRNTKNVICTVILDLLADRDYELITELGYKLKNKSKWITIPIHFVKKGVNEISFECKEMPVMIQVDPYHRVPHININKCKWSKK